MHTYNPNTQEAAAGGLFQIGGLGKVQNEFKGYLGCRVCVCVLHFYVYKQNETIPAMLFIYNSVFLFCFPDFSNYRIVHPNL